MYIIINKFHPNKKAFFFLFLAFQIKHRELKLCCFCSNWLKHLLFFFFEFSRMDVLRDGLKAYLSSRNYVRDSEAVAQEEVNEFLKAYPKANQEMPQSYKIIPRFFTPVLFLTFSFLFKLFIIISYLFSHVSSILRDIYINLLFWMCKEYLWPFKILLINYLLFSNLRIKSRKYWMKKIRYWVRHQNIQEILKIY